MKISVPLFLFGFTLFASQAPAIDFTPYYSEAVDDGVPMRRMYFSDGPQRIFYRPPHTWAISGDSASIRFQPKGSEQATVTLRNGAAEHARIPLDETGLASLRKIVRMQLPADALEVAQTSETVNPVVLQGWTSFEAQFDYQRAGKAFRCSVLLINLDANRQVRFIVDAPPTAFQPLYKATLRTLATWWQTTES